MPAAAVPAVARDGCACLRSIGRPRGGRALPPGGGEEESGMTVEIRVQVVFDLSEAAYQKRVVEEGILPHSRVEVAGYLAELPVALRRELGEFVSLDTPSIILGTARGETPVVDEPPQTLEEAIRTWIQWVRPLREAAKAEAARREAEDQQLEARMARAKELLADASVRAEVEAMAEQEDSEAWQIAETLQARYPDATFTERYGGALEALKAMVVAVRQRQEEAKEAAFGSEMERWISAHGSAHLREAYARGYKVTRSYVLERTAAECPGFVPDTADRAAWKERVDPSPEGLRAEDEARALAAQANENLPESLRCGEPFLVWLRRGPDGELIRGKNDTVGAEAVVVPQYLGRYNLIRIVIR